jgi:hypothetical protein
VSAAELGNAHPDGERVDVPVKRDDVPVAGVDLLIVRADR